MSTIMSSKQNKINHLENNHYNVSASLFISLLSVRLHELIYLHLADRFKPDPGGGPFLCWVCLLVSVCLSVSVSLSLCLFVCLFLCASSRLSLHLADRSHAAPGLRLCLTSHWCNCSPSRGGHLSHNRAGRHHPLLMSAFQLLLLSVLNIQLVL